MAVAEILQPALAGLRGRWGASPLPALLGAWRDGLLLPLPAAWRARLLPASHGERWRLADGPDGPMLAMHALGADGRERALGALPLAEAQARAARAREARHAITLVLPAASALVRRLELPQAAAERLREVLGFEIDRQTPFRPEQVAFDARIAARDAARGVIAVDLVVLPLAALEARLAALGPLAGALDALDVEAGDGTLGVNLLPAARRRPRRDPMRVLQLVLAAAAVGCVALALSVLLDNRGAALDALRDDATAARRAAGEVNALRARLDAIAGGAGFLDEVRARQPATVEVLAMLSERIPEDTWVERLEIDGGQLVLVLQGRNPSALVGLLQDAPGLSNPRLSGTVQADPRTGRQRFNLAATLVPIAPPAPAPAAQDAADAAATAPGEAG